MYGGIGVATPTVSRPSEWVPAPETWSGEEHAGSLNMATSFGPAERGIPSRSDSRMRSNGDGGDWQPQVPGEFDSQWPGSSLEAAARVSDSGRVSSPPPPAERLSLQQPPAPQPQVQEEVLQQPEQQQQPGAQLQQEQPPQQPPQSPQQPAQSPRDPATPPPSDAMPRGDLVPNADSLVVGDVAATGRPGPTQESFANGAAEVGDEMGRSESTECSFPQEPPSFLLNSGTTSPQRYGPPRRPVRGRRAPPSGSQEWALDGERPAAANSGSASRLPGSRPRRKDGALREPRDQRDMSNPVGRGLSRRSRSMEASGRNGRVTAPRSLGRSSHRSKGEPASPDQQEREVCAHEDAQGSTVQQPASAQSFTQAAANTSEDPAPDKTVYGKQDSEALLTRHRSSFDFFGRVGRNVMSGFIGPRKVGERADRGADRGATKPVSEASGSHAQQQDGTAHATDAPSRGQRQGEDKADSEATTLASQKVPSCCGCTCFDFPCCCSHCPVFFCFLVLLVTPIFVVVAWPGINVDTDLNAFLQADTYANDERTAFISALDARKQERRLSSISYQQPHGNDVLNGRPPHVNPTILHSIFDLQLIYESATDKDMLDPRILSTIRALEARMLNLPGWRRLCHTMVTEALIVACDPGVSITNVMWPTDQDPSQERHQRPSVTYNIDGAGIESLPLKTLPILIGTGEVSKALFRKNYEMGQTVTAIRSQFQFNLICCSSHDSFSVRSALVDQMKTEYAAFLDDEFLPFIFAEVEKEENAHFHIYWAGSQLAQLEVWNVLFGDTQYAIGSVIFILVYLAIHTRSPCISFGSIGLILVAIPSSFVVSARLSGANRVTGASILSLFLLVGLGADVVLVFTSFWDVSRVAMKKQSEAARIRYLWKAAGVACLSTSMTTAASFMANLASVLKALREFGFFMGTCIIVAYIYIVCCVPGLLVLHERFVEKCSCYTGIVSSVSSFVHELRQLVMNQLPWSRFTGECSAEATEDERTVFHMISVFYASKVLIPFRHLLLFASLGFTVVFAVCTATAARIDPELPLMFPPEHNQNAGLKASEKFHAPSALWMTREMTVCNLAPEPPRRDGTMTIPGVGHLKCFLNWCHVGVDTSLTKYGEKGMDGSAECMCVPTGYTGSCRQQDSGSYVDVHSRFVGPESVPHSFWTSTEWQDHVVEVASAANTGHTFQIARPRTSSSTNLSTLVQEHWETGTVAVEPYILAPDMRVRLSSSGMVCAASEICYCGTMVCKLMGESLMDPGVPASKWLTVHVPAPRRLGAMPLAAFPTEQIGPLQPAPTVALSDSLYGFAWTEAQSSAGGRRLSSNILVSTVWGIHVIADEPMLRSLEDGELWEFSGEFHVDLPETQRHLYQVCQRLAEEPVLLMVRADCWITGFRSWLLSQNELFPVRSTRFYELLMSYSAGATLPSGVNVRNQMWFDQNGIMQATFFDFEVALSPHTTTASTADSYRSKWDVVCGELNDDAPLGSGGFWHTAALWIRAEAEQAIVGSTINTLVVSLACGFVGALASSSCDVPLSLLVVFTVAGVTIALAFFMTVVMSWALGAIEILGLIVFVGYSITYSLHITHKYREHAASTENTGLSNGKRRHLAVEHALEMMMGAVLGSAFTTLGSSFFLFFCTLVIFVKLASVLFAVTFFAAVFAVVGLPAALACYGPLGLCGCGGLMSSLRGERQFPDRGAVEYDMSGDKGTAPTSAQGSGSTGMRRMDNDDAEVGGTGTLHGMPHASAADAAMAGTAPGSGEGHASFGPERHSEVFMPPHANQPFSMVTSPLVDAARVQHFALRPPSAAGSLNSSHASLTGGHSARYADSYLSQHLRVGAAPPGSASLLTPGGHGVYSGTSPAWNDAMMGSPFSRNAQATLPMQGPFGGAGPLSPMQMRMAPADEGTLADTSLLRPSPPAATIGWRGASSGSKTTRI